MTGCDIDLLHLQLDPLRPLSADGSEPYVDWPHRLNPGQPDVKSRLVRAFSRPSAPEHPATRLLTGHRGVGKTTELNRVSARLAAGEGGRKVFVSTLFAQQWLDIEDVQPEELVLQIVRQLVADLDAAGMDLPAKRLRAFWEKLKAIRPGIEIGVDPLKFSFSLKDFPAGRDEFRKLMRGQLPTVYDLVNRELIPKARAYLRQAHGFEDILLVVDDLDKIPQKVITDGGLTNHENLFLDHAGTLRAISCNLVLTIPIDLAYSPAQVRLQNDYGSLILTVPLVPVRTRTGAAVVAGEQALVEVIAERAARAGCATTGIFEDHDLLRRVVALSGGHMRSLIVFLAEMLDWTDALPLTRPLVERYVSRSAKDMGRALFDADWALLRQVRNRVEPVDDPRFFELLRNHYVFAYEEGDEDYWYGWNPLLDEIERGRPDGQPG